MTYRVAKWLVNGIAPVFGFLLSLWLIWNVETRFFPVVEDFKMTSVVATREGYLAAGELRKVRNCEFIGLTIYASKPGFPKMILSQSKKDIFGSDVGVGHQTWGPWFGPLPKAVANYDKLEIQGTHRCHALWLQTTEYFQMDVKDLPK